MHGVVVNSRLRHPCDTFMIVLDIKRIKAYLYYSTAGMGQIYVIPETELSLLHLQLFLVFCLYVGTSRDTSNDNKNAMELMKGKERPR